MSAKINSKYVENYAKEFSKQICDQYFSQKKYMTGHEIITLSPSPQVNFFTIKTIFEAWQMELEKLKSSPYFDYRDKSVHEALKDFMNVLSRTIKIERSHFEPLINQAVINSINLAVDPLEFYSKEFDKVSNNAVNQSLKENKKYYKWHNSLVFNLIDKAGLEQSQQAYKEALKFNFSNQKDNLEDFRILLNSMGQIRFIDFDEVLAKEIDNKNPEEEYIPTVKPVQNHTPKEIFKQEIEQSDTLVKETPGQPHLDDSNETNDDFENEDEEFFIENIPTLKRGNAATSANEIDPLQTWAKFETEEYSIMKGTIKELSESVGLNQRFMFTKELFDGNPDLMKHALKSIDNCESFVEAINLINDRFVGELKWEKNSDVVSEFLQLIFRKFDQKD
ncbi:hypothetical protein [Aquiflexum sp.]|uniref:hypothetical protein n=1 Tax=Aquiflexum sp. TaxID=1872584 RepID=UPI0035946069